MYYFTNYRGVRGNTIWEGAVLAAQVRVRRRRRHQHQHHRFAVHRAVVRVPLQRAVLRRHRPGEPQQPPVQRQRHDVLERRADATKPRCGYEFFRSQRTGGNSQSSTSYVFNADFEMQDGLPVPHFVPGETYLENYIATRGATMNIDNQSAFVQDRWAISRPSDGQPRSSLRTGEGRIDRRHHQHQHQPAHRAAARHRASTSRATAPTSSTPPTRSTQGATAKRRSAATARSAAPRCCRSYYTGPECIGDERSCASGFNVANYPVVSSNLERVEVPLANIFVDEKAHDTADARVQHVVRPHVRQRAAATPRPATCSGGPAT